MSIAELTKKVEGSTVKVITGTGAAAYGAKLSRVKVIAAYPITPQTTVIEYLSNFIADGELDAKYLTVESEHSALASCIGAAIVGARTFTATSSQGLALMHEMIIWTAASRIPMVMVNVNRALAAPWSIWTDTQDSMSQRDTGWMQLYVENNQEVLDLVILGYKVSEQVKLPTLVNLDGFILSHTSEPVEIYPQDLVDQFLPPYEWEYTLNVENPFSLGALPPKLEDYFKMRIQLNEAHMKALDLWRSEMRNFGEMFGRKHYLVEGYMCDDAEWVILVYGAVSSTVRAYVKALREKGERVGMIRLVLYRPLPVSELLELLKGPEKIAVIDRAVSWGSAGIVAPEIKNILYNAGITDKVVVGYICGLGGTEIDFESLELLREDLRGRNRSADNIYLKKF